MDAHNPHPTPSAPPPGAAAHGSHAVVFVLLAVLTAAMVAVSGADLGLGPDGGKWVILGLAGLQALLVLLFGMHLTSETGLVVAVALLPLLLVAVLIALNLQDAGVLATK